MSKKQEKRSFEKMNFRLKALIKNESVDAEKRTVELTWSTGSKGLRRSYFGNYYEELDMSEKSIDLSRLNGGAPLLKSHDAYDLDSVIGVVERAWLENGEGKAIVRFADDAESDKVFQKVRSGILKNISVGYDVKPDGYEDVSGNDDEIPTYRATDWEPLEISVVSIGFDKKAQIRSKEDLKETEIKEIKIKMRVNPEQEKTVMDEKEKQRLAEEAAQAATRKAEHEKAIALAVEAETQRCVQIRKLVKDAGFEDGLAEEYISRKQTIEQVQTNVELFKKHAAATRVASTTTSETSNEQDLKEGFTDMLLNRVMSSHFPVTEKSKLFYGQSVMRSLEAVIERRRMETDADYAKRVMTTSDLPLILANVAEKTAQKRYDLAEKTFTIWTGSGELKDFKPKSQVRAGDIGELKKRTEAGEYEQASFGEEAESAQLEQYGVKHSFSDKMLINDDLDLIMKVANETGVAVSRLENKLAYDVLKNNAAMSDSEALFSSAHANLGTPGAIGETTFAEAYLKMRTQKSVDERDNLNITPKFLIVPPSLEVSARKFLTSIIPNQTSNVNIFANSVTLVVDAELTDDKYYFVADPSRIDGVKMFRLSGQTGPKVSSRVNWDNDAIELKIGHAVTAAALDFRGMFRNEVA